MWARDASYATLVHLILEQQVSLASAQAAFDRLVVALGAVTPAGVLGLDDAQMRAVGFSRQKAGYARDLARALDDGFDLATLSALTDDEVRVALTQHRGIGRWTADIYLTMCLLRPDIWPRGDLALRTAAAELTGSAKPSDIELAERAEAWRPVPRGGRADPVARLPAAPRPARSSGRAGSARRRCRSRRRPSPRRDRG